MKILTSHQMSKLDRLSSQERGIPNLLLMENAGWNLYLALRDCCPQLSDGAIAIFCGKGNNGGDGLVLARLLSQRQLTRTFTFWESGRTSRATPLPTCRF